MQSLAHADQGLVETQAYETLHEHHTGYERQREPAMLLVRCWTSSIALEQG